ncbi:uncharacterized protein LOC107265429 [Cephus cinctus]|uniref:Uncharacterized protein LOC107265429 n=1 Tax=Cephus cinctus TaxID=211228 RepID=A0AAJ7FG97_CEPCN|nr:uncharacterized protein LOC107265429 [Cephus cinctus]
MYEEEGTVADQKIEDSRIALLANGANTMDSVGVGIGIGLGGTTTTSAGAGLASYWQHRRTQDIGNAANTAAAYWPSFLDCWTTPSIASSSESLLVRDEHGGQ